jgi:hypothetical protein
MQSAQNSKNSKNPKNSKSLKKSAKGLQDISHHFLSAAEADVSPNATGTAGHLEDSNPREVSKKKQVSPDKPAKPVRRKDNCSACAHLIARAGQPFQCRVYSVEHTKHGVERREKVNINDGRTCPHFMRVTSKQIEDILRTHESSLGSEQIREYAHRVDEQVLHTKTITISSQPGETAEEILRHELLNYLMDGYTISEATVTMSEESGDKKRSKKTIHKVNLRVDKQG